MTLWRGRSFFFPRGIVEIYRPCPFAKRCTGKLRRRTLFLDEPFLIYLPWWGAFIFTFEKFVPQKCAHTEMKEEDSRTVEELIEEAIAQPMPSLSLDGRKLTEIPKAISQAITSGKLRNLGSLSLQRNQIPKLPDVTLSDFNTLTELNLYHNEVCFILTCA